MESWHLIALSLSFCVALALLLKPNKHKRLPPGPPAVPVLGNLLWLNNSLDNLEAVLQDLRPRYGPIITLRIGSIISIFISDPHLTHKALVEHGATFADRPAPLPIIRFISNNDHSITSAPYGPTWRLLRRNLVSETLHPSRVKLFADARSWVLRLLISKLRARAGDASGVVFVENFQFSMFCLLVLMCFGEKLDEEAVRAIEVVTRDLLLYGSKLNALAFLPSIGEVLFRKKWNTAVELKQKLEDLYRPLIQARKEHKMQKEDGKDRFVHSHVDSLLDLRIAEEGGRKLTDDEVVGLCTEFMNAGTDTTSSALQWIMAALVNHPEVQEKLWHEVAAVAGADAGGEVKEQDLDGMPYLKAVVMEGLRRYPPAHLMLPHAVSKDVELGGYIIPKGAMVNFMAAEIGWDEKSWEEPMAFKPERFLEGGDGHGVDLTGSREIKMMPFGVGRRICAGLGLATMHLEYFVANLVKEFEWKTVEGEEVDMAEEPSFTVIMKHPLRARLIPRKKDY